MSTKRDHWTEGGGHWAAVGVAVMAGVFIGFFAALKWIYPFLPDRLISGVGGDSFCWQVAVAALAGVAAAGGLSRDGDGPTVKGALVVAILCGLGGFAASLYAVGLDDLEVRRALLAVGIGGLCTSAAYTALLSLFRALSVVR